MKLVKSSSRLWNILTAKDKIQTNKLNIIEALFIIEQ